MLMYKRFALLIFGSLIIVLITFWGFKNNFPGESIARAVKFNFTKQTGIPIEIQDFELEWFRISTPEIALLQPKWLAGKLDTRLLILKRIETPLTSILTSGKTIIYGDVHGGKITTSSYLFSEKPLDILIESVQLEDVPLMSLIPNVSLSGIISLSSQITNFGELRKQKTSIPEGRLRGSIKKAKINFFGGTTLLDFQFPELDFSDIFFDLQIGPLITINNIELQGSIGGIIYGSIQINKNRPQMSLIDLNLELDLSRVLREKLRSITPMLLSFQCDETININIKGSISRLNFPTRNKC